MDGKLYIETDGDDIACESVEIGEDYQQKSRISHESEEDGESSSSQFEGTEKEEDDISIFEVIT
jgi:hypothetical protein